MARKKVSKKKTSKSKALVSWQDKLAALAEQEGQRRTTIGTGSNNIRLSKGKFKYQGEDLGDVISVCVIDFVRCKNYFDSPFDEDNPNAPACFVVSADGLNMRPHDTSPDAQAETCADCWANEFETDGRGKGKACRDSYLLGVVSADEVNEAEPDVAYIRVPPTSLTAWDSYMVKRNKVLNLPALAFITQISFDEEVDYQKLVFEEEGRTPEEAFGTLFDLRETVHETLMTPPDTSNYHPPGKVSKKTKKKSKKKASKKKAKRSRFA